MKKDVLKQIAEDFRIYFKHFIKPSELFLFIVIIAFAVTRISPFTTFMPFRIFSIDREEIVEINLHEAGEDLYTIEDEEQIDEIVKTMNDIRYCFAFPYFEIIGHAGGYFENIILSTETDSAAFDVSGRLIRYRNVIYVVAGNEAREMSDKYYAMIPD